MPVLTLQNGERAGAAFPFDRAVVLGRGRKADIVVDDPSASRRHAQIDLHGRDWQLNDLDSANGTHLNGRPISRPTPIRPGDLIGIGGLTFRYEPDGKKEPSDSTVYFVEEESVHSQIILSKPVELEPPVASDPRQAQILIRLAEILGTAFQENAVLDFVLDELLGATPRADRALVLTNEEEGGELVPTSIRAPGGAPAKVGYSRTLMKQALARREGLVIIDASSEGRASGSDSLLMLGLRSVLCVPITFRNEVFGVVQLDGRPGSGPFTEGELGTALGFAAQIGMSIAYVRLHKRELKRELLDRDLTLARRVQQDFLPQRPPEVAGLRLRRRVHAGAGRRRRLLRLHPAVADARRGDRRRRLGQGRLGGDLRRPRHQRLPLPVGRADLAVGDPGAGQQVPDSRLARRHVRHRGGGGHRHRQRAGRDRGGGAPARRPPTRRAAGRGWSGRRAARRWASAIAPPSRIRRTRWRLATPCCSTATASPRRSTSATISTATSGCRRHPPAGGSIREMTRGPGRRVARFSQGCEQRDDITIVAFGRSR